MALKISVRSTDTKANELTFDQPLVIVGRSSGSDVRLPDPSVSQRHASIRRRGGDYIVQDESSSNGTFVGVVRLPPGAPRVLRPGDLIRVGRVWLEVGIEHGVEPSSANDTKELALRLVEGALKAEGTASAPVVSVERGPDPTAGPLILDEFGHRYVVGRSPQCDLVITDDDLSRRHLELQRIGGDVVVKDLGSKNGTLMDGEPLTRPIKWRNQELVLGNTTLRVEDPLADVMGEIEAAPDDIVSEDESLDPPNAVVSEEDEVQPGNSPLSPRTKAVSRPAPANEAPIAKRPTRSKTTSRSRSSWTTVDLLVAALALVVLALSVAGIAWLMSG
jgi:pSer/pThr/pTyr-binding forkhead associated (FHA) protein